MQYIISVAAIVFVITIHEFIKALTSHLLGDPIPKKEGRVTLNPAKQIEPVGFILMFISGGYGWGRPLSPASVYYKNKKRDTVITNIVPILVTFLIGVSMAGISAVFRAYMLNGNFYDGSSFSSASLYISYFFSYFAIYSMKFAIFNLIPIYPLNGYWILNVFLSPNNVIKMASYEKILQVILILFVLWGTLDAIINPIVSIFLYRW